MANASMKMNPVLEKATQHWKYVAPLLTYPKNDCEYDLLVERLDQLLDIVGGNKKHPLIGLVDALGNLISSYDDEHFEIGKVTGIDALKYLMQTHKLTQSDLHMIGSQGVVSEIRFWLHEKSKQKLKLKVQ